MYFIGTNFLRHEIVNEKLYMNDHMSFGINEQMNDPYVLAEFLIYDYCQI